MKVILHSGSAFCAMGSLGTIDLFHGGHVHQQVAADAAKAESDEHGPERVLSACPWYGRKAVQAQRLEHRFEQAVPAVVRILRPHRDHGHGRDDRGQIDKVAPQVAHEHALVQYPGKKQRDQKYRRASRQEDQHHILERYPEQLTAEQVYIIIKPYEFPGIPRGADIRHLKKRHLNRAQHGIQISD